VPISSAAVETSMWITESDLSKSVRMYCCSGSDT